MEFSDKVKDLVSVIKQQPSKTTTKALADYEAYIKNKEKDLEKAKKDEQPMSIKKAQDDIDRTK